MTLLSICKSMALDVGLSVPDVVATSASREWVEAKSMADIAASELARRVDWGELTEQTTLTGDGTDKTFTLPNGFSRLASGASVLVGTSPLQPVSKAEWDTLVPSEGVPRFFLLEGNQIKFWPYLAVSETLSVRYITSFWCGNGSGSWVADDDEALIDEELILKGLIVRWRRQKGMEYADYEAELEAQIADLASFNDGGR